jgi:tRNA(Ile)-lysidine synthase
MLPFHPERFFRAGDRVAAAVSGGADSVALLELLLEARDRLGIVVSVAHYNHRLRGGESDADAQFVEQLAAAKEVAFFGAGAETFHEANVEALARQDRYSFFEQLVRQGCCGKIATAHTADDQAETVLARLLRGGGPAGLAGILPVIRDGAVVRPLLEVRRSQLRAWATARGLTWREDSSNLDLRFLRNRIRQDLLPQLERDYNPGIVNVLSHTAEVARSEEAHWQRHIEELAARFIRETPEGSKLLLADFVQLDEAQQRRLIRAAVALAQGDLRRLDFDHVERVRHLALAGRGIVEIPRTRVERCREGGADILRLVRIR